MNSVPLSEEALTPEEIEGLKTIGIISQNWFAVTYDKNTRPYAIFDNEEHAKAYRDQFSITSIVEPWPMIIKDLRKGVSQFKSKDNIPSLSEDETLIDHLEAEANKFQQDGGNSQYFAGGIRYAAQLLRLWDTEDKRQPLGIAHLMRCEAEAEKSVLNIPEPDSQPDELFEEELKARKIKDAEDASYHGSPGIMDGDL